MPTPGATSEWEPWLQAHDAQSAPSSWPSSCGVPSTLSICCGRSRWYWNTCQMPDHEVNKYGRKGATAAAPKATSGQAQRRGGPASSSTSGSSASGVSFRAKPMPMTKPAAVYQPAARHSRKIAMSSATATS